MSVSEAALEQPQPVSEAKARRRVGRGLGLFGGYLLVSLWMWRSLLPHFATHMLQGGLFDAGLFTWWLQWTPYALTHGLNPLHTTYLNAPGGVSAMWNTSVIALGVLFGPVTLIFGPVVSYNLACILGPPLSAWTARLWLRRHAQEVPAAIGGLVFGFSPFVVGQSNGGHLMMIWLFLLPVLLMLVEDLLWRSPRPIWPTAPLLGLVVAVQLLIGSEALLIFVLGCAGMALVLALRNPRAAWERVRVVLPAAGVAIGVALALCAWPLIEQFGGNRAIGPPIFPLGSAGGRFTMVVHAPSTLAFHAARGPGEFLTPIENGLFIGWPLLLLLAVITVVLIRRTGVLIAACVVVASLVLQMHKATWHFAGVSMPAPLRLLQDHVSVTRNILPGRFAILMWLAIAWLLAVALDTIATRFPAQQVIAVPLVAAVCLLPLLPGHEVPTRKLAVIPPLFSTSLRRTIPEGATVMIAPMATAEFSAADLWQVEAGMRFRQIGGYMLHLAPNGTPSFHSSAEMLTKLFQIITATGRPYAGEVTPAMLHTARAELRGADVSLFIVGPGHDAESALLAHAEQLFGRRPDERIGGTAIWRVSR